MIRRRRNRELDDEIAAHLRMAGRDRVERGATQAEAESAARREFGNEALIKEMARGAWGGAWLDRLNQDLAFAIRVLAKSPAFTLIAVITLALGIGANTAIFSVLNGLLVRSLPFPRAYELVWVANSVGSGPSGTTSQSFTFRDFRRLNRSFSKMAAYNAFFPYVSYNLTGKGDPERLLGVGVTEGFFSLLGVQPAIGRFFLPEECVRGARSVVVLTYGFWKTKLAADPKIAGQMLIINGAPVEVIGVAPPSFDFVSVFTPGARVDLFTPHYIDRESDRHGNELAIIGRLKPGVTLAAAQTEMSALADRLSRERGYTIGAQLQLLEDRVTGPLRRPLLVLACAVGFVLLIACANLSNLLLARAAARKKEIALRLAVGASRLRLMRQMLTESLVLALLGGAVALPLAFWGTRTLANLRRTSIPMLGQVEFDIQAFLFTLVLSTGAGLLFGLIPAWQATRSDLSDAIKEGATGAGGAIHRDRARSALVISEVALSLMLLGAAGLMMKSFLRLLETDLGFRPDHLVMVRVDPGPQVQDKTQLTAFLDQVVESARQVPGVDGAALTDAVPLDRDRSWGTGVVGESYPPGQRPIAFVRAVGPGYFSVMRIPVLAGRTFDSHDRPGSETVVVINESMAKQLFHGQNPLGREVWAGGKCRVIGVVRDVKHSALDQEAGLEFYFPYSQGDVESADLVVRTTLEPAALASALRRKIWSFAPNQPLSEFRTVDQLVETASSPRRFTLVLLGIFAALAVVLASVGIYGVINYSVGQRTREIGIRMALGADAARLEWQVVKEALGLSLAGSMLGLAGLAILSRYIASLLFQVTPTDPAIFTEVTLLLIGVAAIAGYIPARQASRVNPVNALRVE